MNGNGNLRLSGSPAKAGRPERAVSPAFANATLHSKQLNHLVAAPPAYRPAPYAKSAAPPVQSQQSNVASAAQRKVPAASAPPVYKPTASAARPAPPVYSPQRNAPRTQPPDAPLQTKAPTAGAGQYVVQAPILRPGGYQEIHVSRVGAGSVGSLHLHPDKNGRTYLSDLNVSPDHRRHGVAKMLVQAAQRAASAQGYSGIVLEASPSANNIDPQSLISMYQRMGFRRTGLSERGKPLLEFGRATVQRKTAPSLAPPPVYRPQMPATSQAKLVPSHSAASLVPPAIQLSRRKKFVAIPFNQLGFTVEHTPPPQVKVNWSTVTSRDSWWDELGYRPKEGDVNCRISRLESVGGHNVHATVTKTDVPLNVDPTLPSEDLAKILLGKKFHVTLETGSGGSGAHYFYNDGASDALKSATYNKYLSDMEEKCFDEFQAVVGQIDRLLARK